MITLATAPADQPTINVELAEYSELFMLIAAFIYTLAFILFTIDAARSSATIRRVEAELAEEQAAERQGSLVAAGAATPPAEAQDLPDKSAMDDELVDNDMAYTGARRPLANAAVALTAVALAAHAFAVAARGLAANRWPMGNMYEFLVSTAVLVTAVYLVTLIRRDLRFLGTFVLGLIVTMMIVATIVFPTPIGHVQPALQSPWIAIHVSLASMAIGLFVITFAMNVLQLIQAKREKALAEAGPTGAERTLAGTSFLRLVPNAFSLENWSYRLNAVAFVFWTLGPMITGAIWAQQSWGRYWGWDTKEIWTFVIWVVYACYLHARATRGWTGTRSAWLSIIGFACIVFNYAVVNVYFPGLHSYAGLPE
ncbi:c-type cytochrome biogenesis protein CcsB [Nesterenkonia sp. NBAIMH1]|uniref:c-type cytochrome biogenesis protein CcsB n=1 Tax=Nesterenkonia sp. NBAIMH1 TaxID=2600320 RepID=UPI0011B59939|nr:c-type cytochrome biogenesis protein CcsB [Nesterenkonia sp. NBAIMH1]